MGFVCQSFPERFAPSHDMGIHVVERRNPWCVGGWSFFLAPGCVLFCPVLCVYQVYCFFAAERRSEETLMDQGETVTHTSVLVDCCRCLVIVLECSHRPSKRQFFRERIHNTAVMPVHVWLTG